MARRRSLLCMRLGPAERSVQGPSPCEADQHPVMARNSLAMPFSEGQAPTWEPEDDPSPLSPDSDFGRCLAACGARSLGGAALTTQRPLTSLSPLAHLRGQTRLRCAFSTSN